MPYDERVSSRSHTGAKTNQVLLSRSRSTNDETTVVDQTEGSTTTDSGEPPPKSQPPNQGEGGVTPEGGTTPRQPLLATLQWPHTPHLTCVTDAPHTFRARTSFLTAWPALSAG